jgi:hypothetical protein
MIGWAGYRQRVSRSVWHGFGAGISTVTEAEAKRLGMKIMPGNSSINGSSGVSNAERHYAVADRLKVGDSELRNVAFSGSS